MNVVQFLKDRGVEFEIVEHRPAYTASELAWAAGAPIEQVAKTVLLRADHGYRHFVVVIPANAKIDLGKLSRALGGSRIELASEQCLADHCPDCERGVLPPFGSQYGLRTIIDAALLAHDAMMFAGNTHSQAIWMKTSDYQRLELPLVLPITEGSRAVQIR